MLRNIPANYAWLSCLILFLPNCAYVRSQNSPEARLRYSVTELRGETVRLETHGAETLTGILVGGEWPQIVLLTGDREIEVDAATVSGVWQSHRSKSKGAAIGAIIFAVPMAFVGHNMVKHPVCLKFGHGSSCITSAATDGRLARGAVVGAAIGAFIGGLVGVIASKGELRWRKVYP